jgi:hypothetical protein
MLYKLTKIADDQRAQSNGYVMPDGYFRIVEASLKNAGALKGVERDGWVVEEYEGDKVPGLYREYDDMLVDQWSALTKAVNPNVEVVAPAPGYIDPGSTVGLSLAEMRTKTGKRPLMEDPVLRERRERIAIQAKETRMAARR